MEMSHLLDSQLHYITQFGDEDKKQAAAAELELRAAITYN